MALQSLRLVDRHDVDRVLDVHSDGFGAEHVVPMGYEAWQVGTVLIDEGQQVVQERMQVGRLSFPLRLGLGQAEQRDEPLAGFK